MRRWSFIVAVLGILILLFILGTDAGEVDSLEEVIEGSKVVVRGEVVSENNFGDFSVMNVGGIEVVCDCIGYKGLDVLVEGIVEVYEGRKQVRVLRIEEG